MIDRISMSAKIGCQDLYKVLYGQLYSMREEGKNILPNGKICVRHEKYTTRLDYYPVTYKQGCKRKIADITMGSSKLLGQKERNRYVKLTIYPSKFEQSEFDHFKWIIDTFFQEFGYSTFYSYGKVNYLELAYDSQSHINHSFLPYQKYISKSEIYTEDDGSCGTGYIGSPESDHRFRIYDKRKKLIADGLKPFSDVLPHTRFESVSKKLDLSPCELGKMCNPFPKLKVADLGKAKALHVDTQWQAFLVTCQFEGVPRALHMIKEQARRKKYIAALNSVPASWWKPHAAWKRFPEALIKIAP